MKRVQKARLSAFLVHVVAYLGVLAHSLLAQPLSPFAYSLGQRARKLPSHAPFCLSPDHVVQLSFWMKPIASLDSL